MQDAQQTRIQALLARVSQGDRTGFEQLFDATSAQLHALGVSILKDRPVAEDLLAQVYTRIWAEAGNQPASGLSPLAWLLMLARDAAIERLQNARLPGGLTRPDPVGAIWLEGANLAALARRDGLTTPAMRAALHDQLLDLRDGLAPQPPVAEGP